ncbi:MAG: DUF2442 domain-containing protein [Bacteroidales bacterium]|nr:DUF2442 domain-containing protein [Bacteroidales bacterium]
MDFRIVDFKISSETLSFQMEGIRYSFTLSEISPRLAEASDAERDDYRFSPSGYGIRWESIDEDLSFQGLIKLG